MTMVRKLTNRDMDFIMVLMENWIDLEKEKAYKMTCSRKQQGKVDEMLQWANVLASMRYQHDFYFGMLCLISKS